MLFHENKKLNHTCRYVAGGLVFSPDDKILVCNSFNNLNEKFVLYNNFNGINFDSGKLKSDIINLRNNYSSLYNKNCLDCLNYIKFKSTDKPFFKFIELNHWKCCFLNCKYCRYSKTDDISQTKHYDINPVLQDLLDNNLINQYTKIIIDCGDALIHPEFDKLIYFFINNNMKNIDIYTSAQRYCHSISEAIDKKLARIFISIDSGCPYIYEKVKGSNKFDITISNIRRYLDFDDKLRKRVILTYTVVKGINDNKKEILDWFLMSRGLGIKKLFADIDDNWYDEINGFPDENLKEVILFIKELSVLNDYDIEFSSKLQKVYNNIIKDNNVCI